MCDDNKDVLSQEDVEGMVSDIIENEGVQEGKLVIYTGSNKGDGLMSFMTRVDVLGENKNLHLIIKCAPRSEVLRKSSPVHKFYAREIQFYSQIYPALQKFQEGRNVEKPFKSIPQCYKTDCSELNEYLILENISKTGFGLWDKRIPMDENHIQLILREYAKFHAISYAMQEQEPKKFKELTQDFPSLFSPDHISPGFFILINRCFDKLMSIFEEEKEIYGKIKYLKENIREYILHINNDATKFPTIVQGDCWCNNFMFKYEDPTNKLKPTAACLLDFQICCLNSPFLDLSYLLYSNTTKERLDKLDSYLDFYHEHFSAHLLALGCKTNLPNREELKSEWALFSKYGFIFGLMVIRTALTDPEEATDFTEILEAGRPMSDLLFRDLNNKNVMDKKFVELTRHMYDNGFLNFEK